MANHGPPQQIRVHTNRHPPAHGRRYDTGGDIKSQFSQLLPQEAPSAGKVIAFLALLPVGGSLLGISGIMFLGSLIGLTLITPLLIIFSPVLVPAAIAVALGVAGVLTSGAFGLTGLSSLSWVLKYFSQATGGVGHRIGETKGRTQDVAAYVGEKTKDVGETIQTTAQQQQSGGREKTQDVGETAGGK